MISAVSPSGESVAFQGEPGAYSELAAIEFFGPHVKTVPCPGFEEVFEAVTLGQCRHGMVPVENSLAGSIHRNYDLMLRNELHIVGEHHLRVSHSLLTLPGVQLEQVKRVHSHPQALAQCEASLRRLGLQPVAEADTAGSARLVAERQDQHAAALASRRAAEVYGLQVLKDSLEDNPENYTRFLVLASQPLAYEDAETGDFKTSVVFSLPNKPGSLFKALSVFALREIDLTKIESRPQPGKPWEYMFYIDFAGHAGAANCRRALEHLAELAPFLRVLGTYPRERMDR
jgi:prephenate dehydratase